MQNSKANHKKVRTTTDLRCECGGRLEHMATSTQGVAMFVEEYACRQCNRQGSIRSKITGVEPLRFAGAVFGGTTT